MAVYQAEQRQDTQWQCITQSKGVSPNNTRELCTIEFKTEHRTFIPSPPHQRLLGWCVCVWGGGG
jgi:hypothetical protein